MDRPRLTRQGASASWLAAVALALAVAPATARASRGGPPPDKPSRPVCPGQVSKAAGCHARVITNRGGRPLAGPGPSGYGPADFHSAYALPTSSSTPQTIAIVDAYDSPTVESDLAVYSSNYGLPACTTANDCFDKVNQNGVEGSYPKKDADWALEIALDVQTAHAICQNCKILLVEAFSNSFADLSVAVSRAVSMGATEISNSYGGPEFSGEAGDTSYDHPGIAITASAGDDGYAAEYPAASPHVVAVGGTTLTLTSGGAYGSETVWPGSGSGCSAYIAAPSWQTSDPNWQQTGCGAKRGIADVAADADPDTGAAVYDTTKIQGQSGWFTVGGTSLSAPLIAGVYALAGGASTDYPAGDLYAHQSDSPASLHDVASGSNGSCGTSIMCKGAAGYDGPTGVGTPKGIGAFTVDTTPPETTIDSGPSGPTNDAAPSFAFSSSESGSSFQCRVDSAAFASCTSPHTTATLAEGPHTFEARATDAAANTDPTPASRSFTVDTIPPASEAASPAATDSAEIAVSYDAADAGSGLAAVQLWVRPPGAPEFALAATDDSSGASGSFSYVAGEGPGAYAFYTRALDAVGNHEPAPPEPDSTTVLEDAVAQPGITPPAIKPPRPLAAAPIPVAPLSTAPTPDGASFRVLKRIADRRRGGVKKLRVRVRGPGILVLFGRKVRKVRRRVLAAGSVNVPVRSKPRFRSRSRRPQRTKVRLRFMPQDGSPATRALRLRPA